jgi:IS1 family transposase
MAESGCAACSFRARYDKNPRSLLGRLWRWHANWCPGWKSYMKSLPDQERRELAEKYDLPKFK